MKRTFLSYTYFILFLLAFIPCIAAAQSTITFRVNMSNQIKDSTFIPSKSRLEISGNQLPFSKTRTIALHAKNPQDSIYVANVQFPSFLNGRELDFHYLIKKGGQKTEENNPRSVTIDKGDKVLPLIGFDEVLQ